MTKYSVYGFIGENCRRAAEEIEHGRPSEETFKVYLRIQRLDRISKEKPLEIKDVYEKAYERLVIGEGGKEIISRMNDITTTKVALEKIVNKKEVTEAERKTAKRFLKETAERCFKYAKE
jgi:hypothetical protein